LLGLIVGFSLFETVLAEFGISLVWTSVLNGTADYLRDFCLGVFDGGLYFYSILVFLVADW